MNDIIFFLLLIFVIPAIMWGIPALIRKIKGPMTAHAAVLSRRMEPGKWGGRYSDNWNRLITFQLTDGSEIELYVSKEEYETLKDGQSGQITWDEDTLTFFDPDRPDSHERS